MKKETGHLNFKRRNWLISGPTDLLILFAPVWVLWIIFFSDAPYFQSVELPLWAWAIFILGIDVSHVWSSLFRTYLEKDELKTHRTLLILTPIFALALSIIIMSFSMQWFWRVMAYIAVFHFIKQQYGFVALYKLKSGEKRKQIISDKVIIYIATLYPLIFWHLNSTATFNWFVSDDFFPLHKLFGDPSSMISFFQIVNVLYWGTIGFWLFLEIKAYRNKRSVSIGKIIWVVTTAINWWFGIVYFNSDVIFSISNVVAHGIPYIALIYYYKLKKEEVVQQQPPRINKKVKWLFILFITIILAALTEEYFWDMLIYREHSSFFESIHPYNWEQLANEWWIIFAIALLALPQQIHYVIDGFIWKMNSKNKYLKPMVKPKDES